MSTALASDVTPMMKQYLSIKEDHRDAILLFRLGDFYEMFFDDAVEASKILDIALTTRNRSEAHQVPLCGVPYHSIQPYITKLLEAGKRIAICDQVEDPATAKGVVKREVVRIITPGVVLDGEHLDAKSHNFLAAVIPQENSFGLAFVDVSTGWFEAGEVQSAENLLEEIARRSPKELVFNRPLKASLKETIARYFPKMVFTETGRGDRPVAPTQFVAPTQYTEAAALAWDYLRSTQKSDLPHITSIQPLSGSTCMRLDEATKRNLELVESMLSGERSYTLLEHLDRTKTSMGARALRTWILHPLLDEAVINARLNAVHSLIESSVADAMREALKEVYDLERIMSRIAMKNASPRDVVHLSLSLSHIPSIKQGIASSHGLLETLGHELDELSDLRSIIASTLVEEPPFSPRDGGMIRNGISTDLDELRTISHHGKDFIARLEAQEKESTGIGSLKVRYNKVFGYYIEVTHAHRDKIPLHYIRKQTLVNAERYITPELKEYEEKVLGSEEKSKALEYHLFTALRDQVAEALPRVMRTAKAVAELDALLSLAEIASEFGYVRPDVMQQDQLDIIEGRHPIVERLIPDERFVPNDVCLNDASGRMMVITGPNMSGKSTVMRQTALIVLMAQIGSFVPAKRAVIGIVDRIFTRVGASDALALGKSTFMVEMSETALILNQATERSLVIVDEIGRGTSTFDGLAIAWAVAEDLHDRVKARTLFATHYHELTDLALTKPMMKNVHIAVKEVDGKIVFLRKLIPGGTSRSYGIHVAKLAGIPAAVIDRAEEVLQNLEQGEFDEKGEAKIAHRHKKLSSQLGLFLAKSIFLCIVGFSTLASAETMTEKELFERASQLTFTAQKTQSQPDALEAIDVLNQFHIRYPKSKLADDALYSIAGLRDAPLKQKDKAVAALTALIKRYPQEDKVTSAKALLAKLQGNATKPKPIEKHPAIVAKKSVAVVEPTKKTIPQKPFVPSGSYNLEDIKISGNNESAELMLDFDRSVALTTTYIPMGKRTGSPAHMILDIPHAFKAEHLPKKMNFDSPHVASVKIKRSWFTNRLICDLELKSGVKYSVEHRQNDVVILLSQKKGNAVTTASEHKEAPTPLPKPSFFETKPGTALHVNDRKLLIVIDPGHGGEDTGAVGKQGVKEKDVALTIAKRLARELKTNLGANVILTRTSDATLSLEERNRIANEHEADLFLSIHANASTDRKAHGLQTYFLNVATDKASEKLASRENASAKKPLPEVEHILSNMMQTYQADESQLLAADVQKSMVSGVSKHYDGVRDLKVQSALFYVLVGAKCPSILIESSFISNPQEERRLKNGYYQEHLAKAITRGIKKYVTTRDARAASL
ncbi:MAG: DNA mismatch repair protein MutS [Deltaproteobacteria bacterium]|nr:DNA mismatch repair protein MutS [Deltaproteobacteria bacterium]